MLINTLDTHAELITVTLTITECRDVKDNFLLALAVDGKADYLLTGDKDLLELKKIQSAKIQTMAAFLALRLEILAIYFCCEINRLVNKVVKLKSLPKSSG